VGLSTAQADLYGNVCSPSEPVADIAYLGRLSTSGPSRMVKWPCASALKLSPENVGSRFLSLLQSASLQTFSALFRTAKSPTAAGIPVTGLGFGERNVPQDRSPKADLSPELGAWPIYSTSFFLCGFSGLSSLANRKVRIPFACRIPRWLLPTAVDTAPTLHNQRFCPVPAKVDDSPHL
jgi:hypothetical protein